MRFFIRLLGTVIVLANLAFMGVYVWALRDLPSPREIESYVHTPTIRIVDRNGQLLYDVLDSSTGRQRNLTLDEIPLHLRHATIATEDGSFYSNPGVDLVGIARAAWLNWQGKEIVAGGSTITQQLVRNLLLSDEERSQQTVRRKVRESWLAWRLSRYFTKDEILTLYLNQIYYGSLSYGIEAAAQTYFGRSAADLSLAQSALIAGLPQSPAVYSPLVNPDAAKSRQAVVLDLMAKSGYITADERALAWQEPLPYSSAPYPIEAAHFVMMVQAEVDQLYSTEELIQFGGLTVRTTLDLNLQKRAEQIVQEQIYQLDEPAGIEYSHNVNNGALVALDPLSGQIITLVGNTDYFDGEIGGAINMAVAPRQPGSTLKPIIYAAAMDPTREQPYTAATMLLDVRTTFMTRKGEPYEPVNFSRTENGPVRLRPALAASLNIPAVLAMDEVGVTESLDLLADFGLEFAGDPIDQDLSFALGGGEVRLLDLTRAYAAFANGGERIDHSIILDIRDSQGELLYTDAEPSRFSIIDERIAWLISDILSDDQARELSFGRNSILQIDRPSAAKTGTTNDFRDNWTVGYTPDLVVGVWVGNVDLTPMVDVTGISGAGPIWHRFMRAAHEGSVEKEFIQPDGLVERDVCALSGMAPSPDCPFLVTEWFIDGTQPRRPDTVYTQVEIDSWTGLLVTPDTPADQVRTQLVLDLPPAAVPWAREAGVTLLSDLEIKTADLGNMRLPDRPIIELLNPVPNARYRLSPSLPADSQRMPIEVVGNRRLQQVRILLNGEELAVLDQPPFLTYWPLELGYHQIWAEATTQDGELLLTQPLSFQVTPPEDDDETWQGSQDK